MTMSGSKNEYVVLTENSKALEGKSELQSHVSMYMYMYCTEEKQSEKLLYKKKYKKYILLPVLFKYNFIL